MLNTKSNMLTLCSGNCADLGPCTKQRVVPYQLSSAYINLVGVSIHWTGLLDWNTGLDYWTDILNHKKQFSSVNLINQSESVHIVSFNEVQLLGT